MPKGRWMSQIWQALPFDKLGDLFHDWPFRKGIVQHCNDWGRAVVLVTSPDTAALARRRGWVGQVELSS
jgi:hypothetical protein